MPEEVRWRAGSQEFAIRTSNADLLAEARRVLGPWLVDGTGPLRHRWEVEGPADTMLTLEYQAISLYHSDPHWLALHGALLSRNGQGIAVIGPAEAGKSTLAVSLWQAGWQLACDDCVLLQPNSLRCRPGPRRVSLRPGSRELLADELWQAVLATPSCQPIAKGVVFHPFEVDGRPPVEEVALRAVFMLARRGGSQGPLAPEDALMALLPYSSVREQGWAALSLFEPLARQIPVFDLPRGPLVEMLARMEDWLGTPRNAGPA